MNYEKDKIEPNLARTAKFYEFIEKYDEKILKGILRLPRKKDENFEKLELARGSFIRLFGILKKYFVAPKPFSEFLEAKQIDNPSHE